MYKNNSLCDDVLYIKGMYNQGKIDTYGSMCRVLADNKNYRFIENPFGGVDFYKVTRNDGDVIPIAKNLHKETIYRFLEKYNIPDSSWFIKYPDDLGLPETMKISGKVYERINSIYRSGMYVKS